MSSLNVRLPHYLHEQLRQLAQREGISMNQFITLAIAEKITALESVDYWQARAKRVDQAAYQQVLAAVPNVPPDERDAMPTDLQQVFATDVAADDS